MEFYTPGFNSDPLHITLRATGAGALELAQALENDGIYVESILGRGCLLMLGAGSEECDVDLLLASVSAFHKKFKGDEKSSVSSKDTKGNRDANAAILERPPAIEQVISPRQAFFSAPHMVSLKEAIGKVSADCIAPCPPGMPVVVPGSRVPEEILELESQIAKLRVVADGP
jgi:lysine decarboxylase